MERVLWTNRHVTDQAVAAFGKQGSPALSSSAVAGAFKRSIADDIKARKAGLYVGDDGTPAEANQVDAAQAMRSAMNMTGEPTLDAGAQAKADAARRWQNLMAWQARVTALDRLAAMPSGPMDFAKLAQTAAAARAPSAAAKASSNSPVVTFSAAKDKLTIPSRSSAPVPPRVLPRPPSGPPAASVQDRPSPARRSLMKPPAGGPKTAEEKQADEAAIRASIARARAKLAAKRRLAAKKAGGE
jgi:hypothetical protein